MKTSKRIFFEEFEPFYFFHGSSRNWHMKNFHYHSQYEIWLPLNSGATVEVGNRQYNVSAGDLFLINGKEHHRVRGAENKPHERYVLQFNPDLLKDISNAFDYNFTKLFEADPYEFIYKIHLSEKNLTDVENLLQKIEKIALIGYTDQRNLVKLKLSIMELLLFINEIYEYSQSSTEADAVNRYKPSDPNGQIISTDSKKRINDIKEHINTHITEKLDLDDIAKFFYLSKYQLSRYFKEQTGFTVAQYITNQKLAQAKKMLKDGHYVTDVAHKLAYSSDTHFISVFKKHCGITPKQYTKSL